MFGKLSTSSPIADSTTRFKVWSLVALVYAVLVIFNWASGYALEGYVEA